MKWKMVDRIPKPITESEWLEWASTHDRSVKVTHLWDGEIVVDTSFLGTGVLFETAIFGGKYHGYTQEWYTWAGAEDGHKKVVRQLRQGELTCCKAPL